jgi:hypothetical protein
MNASGGALIKDRLTEEISRSETSPLTIRC